MDCAYHTFSATLAPAVRMEWQRRFQEVEQAWRFSPFCPEILRMKPKPLHQEPWLHVCKCPARVVVRAVEAEITVGLGPPPVVRDTFGGASVVAASMAGIYATQAIEGASGHEVLLGSEVRHGLQDVSDFAYAFSS